MSGLKHNGTTIDRKMLAELAVNQPQAFTAIVNTVKEAK